MADLLAAIRTQAGYAQSVADAAGGTVGAQVAPHLARMVAYAQRLATPSGSPVAPTSHGSAGPVQITPDGIRDQLGDFYAIAPLGVIPSGQTEASWLAAPATTTPELVSQWAYVILNPDCLTRLGPGNWFVQSNPDDWTRRFEYVNDWWSVVTSQGNLPVASGTKLAAYCAWYCENHQDANGEDEAWGPALWAILGGTALADTEWDPSTLPPAAG